LTLSGATGQPMYILRGSASSQLMNPFGSSRSLITEIIKPYSWINVNPFLHKKTFFNLLTRRPLSAILIPVMKLKEIKNGSIYYNTKKNRPERVISNSFSSSRVVTECPRKSQNAVSTSNIRLANNAEVEKYLNKTRKGNLMTFFGRLFSPKKLA